MVRATGSNSEGRPRKQWTGLPCRHNCPPCKAQAQPTHAVPPPAHVRVLEDKSKTRIASR